MKIQAERKLTIKFELTEFEARLLMATVQNPIYPDESADMTSFREKLFTEIKRALNPQHKNSCNEPHDA